MANERDEKQLYLTNYAQKAMVIERNLLSDPLVYNLTSFFKLIGKVDEEKFRTVASRVVARHSAFCTYFVEEDEEIYQKICKSLEFSVPLYQAKNEEELMILRQKLNTPFDLSKPPLFKLALIEMRGDFYFAVNFHHSILDGSSVATFFQEILDAYSDKKLREVKADAIDYAVAEKARWSQGALEEQEKFWLSMYSDGVPALDFPTDKPRPAILEHKGKRIIFDIDEDLAKSVKETAKKNNATPFSVLLAAYAVLLSRYSGKEDLVIGVPFAGRMEKRFARTLGMFIHNLPWRIKPEGKKKFSELVSEIQQAKELVAANQEYPLAELVKKLNLPMDMSHNTMFDMVFNFLPAYGTLSGEDLSLEMVRDEEDPAISDLAFRVNKLTKSYYVELTYSTALFVRKTMEQISRDYLAILNEVIQNSEIQLKEFQVINGVDRKLLDSFNLTEEDYDKNQTMIDLFKQAAELYSDRCAVKDDKTSLTYQEFDKLTNRIAQALKAKGIGREDIVAFMLPRTSSMLTVMYGIIKAGAAFLPIDPEYPAARIKHVLNDSQAKYLVVSEKTDKVESEQAILLDELLACSDETSLNIAIKPEDLCYVIYTSGSTGKPKGVMVEHHSAVNFSQPLERNILSKSIAQKGNVAVGIGTIAFDIALSEIFPALSNGLTFVIADEATVNQPDDLGRLMLREKVDVLQITPSRLIPFLENETFCLALGELQVLLSAAEVFTPQMLKKINSLTQSVIINGYGPSECTIGATFAEITEDKVTIGRPISNVSIHILNEDSREVPFGVLGELCIGGEGVGRGYYGQPELTAEKFTEWQGQRIYHTGDMAAWMRDGNIDFKGRIDDLVKLHGLRIELGEIEAAMQSFTGLARALVVVKAINKVDFLCAYYQASLDIDILELKTHLAKSLVYYMIPTIYIPVTEFPLTPNGKIDKRALPEPELVVEEIVDAKTEREAKLLNMVKEILNQAELGVTSNLFNLGLTSILAIKLSVLVQNELKLKLTTKDILTSPTVRQLALIAVAEATELKSYAKQDSYPLTENQMGLYVEWEKNREAIQYNIPFCLKFTGLKVEKLSAALIKTVNAHPYLKAKLTINAEGEVLQLRRDEAEVKVLLEYLTTKLDKEFFISRLRPFDLLHDDLYRLEIYRAEDEVYLFMDIHHIVYDGGSSDIFLADLNKAYAGEELYLEQFTAFDRALEEKEILASEKYKEAKGYFASLLADTESTALEARIKPQGEGKSVTKEIILPGAEITAYCRQQAVTANIFFMTAWLEVLSRFTGEKAVQITSISNGRSAPHLANMVGMLVKTIPVVYRRSNNSVEQVLKELQEQLFNTLNRDYYPFADLVAEKGVSPLINYAYQGGLMESMDLAGQAGEILDFHLDTVKFQLNLTAYPRDNDYVLALEYDDSIYHAADIGLLMKTVQALALTIISAKDRPLIELPLVSEEEKAKLLHLGQGKKLEYDKTATILDRFREAAEKMPDKTAVIYRARKLSYSELDEMTDRLAKYLIKQGAEPEKPIGIMLDRSEYLVICSLAVLKSGAAYMPLDYSFPTERLNYMVEDAGVNLILSEEDRVEKALPDFKGRVLKKEDLSALEIDEAIKLPKVQPHDMLIILYTSGSTGKPKGCVLEHRNLQNFCYWYQDEFAVCETDCSLGYANFGFDAHMIDFYPFLTCGGTICIAQSEIRLDLDELNRYMESNKVTVAFMTTQIGRQFVELYDNQSLRLLSIGGEKLSTVKKPPYRFYNLYGPTECTVASTLYNITEDYDCSLIGKPLSNYNLYILDKAQNLLPFGAAGELCIGGAGVSRGYLHREDLNAEQFIANPYADSEENSRIYRTGDLVRWDKDGNIEYLNRMDKQVKLRGLRIELGEIENRLESYPEVMAAAVAVQSIGESQNLCAYYTAQAEIKTEDLQQYLGQVLAAYMVPDIYLKLEKMPLTSNGKVDRKALPLPDISAVQGEIIAPEGEREEKILALVSKLLGTDDLGVNNNLFSLGLTSLLAIKLSALLEKELRIKVSTKQILAEPTIREMAEKSTAEIANVKSYALRDSYPLTANQKGIYIEWEKNREALQYNVPFCLKFTEFDGVKLKAALTEVVAAHPYLKTRLAINEKDEIVQLRRDEAEIKITLTQLKEVPDREFFRALVQPFDLLQDDLYRLSLYTFENEVYLFMDIHHIIYDGSSTAIFFKDLGRAYAGEKLTAEAFTAFDRSLEEEEILAEQRVVGEDYFRAMLGDSEPTNLNPVLAATGNGQEATTGLVLDRVGIEAYCQQKGITENVFFMTAFMEVLARLTGEETVQITSISNGRSGGHLENTIGMFVKTIPLVYQNNGSTAKLAMQTMQNQLFKTLSHDYYPFTDLAERFGVQPIINYAYQGGLLDEGFNLGKSRAEVIELTLNTPKFPLSFTVIPQKAAYNLSLEYDDSLYQEQEMKLLLGAVKVMAEELAGTKDQPLNKLPLISEEQRKELLKLSSGQSLSYNAEETFVDCFNRQAKVRADLAAVIDSQSSLSYQELAEQSDTLAAELIRLGVKQDSFVAVMLPIIKEFMVCTLGVFKAGGAYVPLDSEYPNERLLYMLEDSEAKVLITTRAMYEEKQKAGDFRADNIIFIDEFDLSQKTAPLNNSQAENLAYMIYTSGSTGKPKGVMIQHQAMTAFVQAMLKLYDMTAEDKIVCHSSFSFDASIEDLYVILAAGGELHLIAEELRRDLNLLYQYLLNHGITGGSYTTQFGLELLTGFKLPVRYLTVGGEKMNKTVKTPIKIFNAYGPTEFTVNATCCLLDNDKEYGNIPIGQPLPNSYAYVVDKNFNLLPRGAAGELCMAGAQIAQGYWQREELTDERFVNNPYATDKNNQRMYRTGDLVRWNEAGELEYFGRIDNQVKLRGFRIELGEIESRILSFEKITGAVAEVKEISGGQHLCAYFTAENTINKDCLKKYLAERLTDYMVPDCYLQLDKLPLTPNGKINRKALPKPDIQAVLGEIIAPENAIEEQLFQLVADILGTDEFGVTNNLFNLGLTSIMAIKLSALIQKELGLKISTKDILDQPTIREMIGGAAEVEQIKAYPKQDSYPLTENQMGLYIEWEKNREGLQYNIPMYLKFKGVKAEKLAIALRKTINAHPYLKTRLTINSKGEVVQLRRDEAEVRVTLEYLTTKPDKAFFVSRVKPFDLLHDDLYRLEIYRAEDEVYLFMDIHHSIYDGGSTDILLADLNKAYAGEELLLEKFTAFDRALEEKEILASPKYDVAEGYFGSLLAGTESTNLSAMTKPVGEGQSVIKEFILTGEKIKTYCREQSVTENVFFMTAFMAILSRFTGEKAVQITSVSNGRSAAHLASTVGMLVKTIPIVYRESRESANQVLQAMQEQLFNTLDRDYYPFTALAENKGVQPLINYVYQGGLAESSELLGQRYEVVELALNTVKFPLNLMVYPRDNDYVLVLEYDDSLYHAKDIEQLLKSLEILSLEIAKTAGKSIAEMSLISEAEEKKLLQLAYGGKQAYDDQSTFVDVFLRQAANNPKKTVVAAENGRLSFNELNQRSDLLAGELVRLGLTQNEFVGIMLPRIKEFMVSTLAIFKAGGAYVPLDSEYPNERLLYMLKNSQAKILLTTRSLYEEKNQTGAFTNLKVIYIDELNFNESAEPINQSQPEGLAYMIYTSGSTGQPKGVMIRHLSLVAYLSAWQGEDFAVLPEDHISCYPTFSFDASVDDLYGSLFNGAALYIIPSELRKDLFGLAEYLKSNGITGGTYPTQLGMELLNQDKLDLRFIRLGGEKLKPVKKCRTKIINGYGPTEFTVCSCTHTVNQETDTAIPIGRPLKNSWSYVLDAHRQMLPQGVIGELCIAGRQIAKGYWNKPELTKATFIDNPYSDCEDNQKLYCTGDLVRWNSDDELEYVGRKDKQIKLRGFRIGLGEIESRINSFEGIVSAAADVKEINGNQQLCAYFVAEVEIDVKELRAYLAAVLTDYMVPSAYMQLAQLPLTPNGKINRKALPEPKMTRMTEYVAPTNELEEKICEVFSNILNSQEIGIKDDFFTIGGTSILAMKVIIQITNLGYPVQYGDLFNWKTPEKIAYHLTHQEEEKPEYFDLADYDYTAVNQVLGENYGGFDTDFEVCDIGDVLLTGATGYLGIHVLHYLLTKRTDRVYCLLRPDKLLRADDRLKTLLMYYFEDSCEELFGTRIFVVEGDITNKDSLKKVKDYSIKTVINCAAMVKHYDAGNKMEEINYQGVLNLIELCQQEDLLLIQTSTYSISGILAEDGELLKDSFSEDTLYVGQITDNKYIWTKFKAERAILEAVSNGLRAKIMRLGNLMARASDGEFQINTGNNAFLNYLKSCKILGAIPLTQVATPGELSQIDKVAEAIVVLSSTPDNMVVFHPYNNFAIIMGILFKSMAKFGYQIDLVSEASFQERFAVMMHDETKSQYLSGILHYGQADGSAIKVSNDFTTMVLYKLGFIWPLPDQNYVEEFMEKLDGLGFFDENN